MSPMLLRYVSLFLAGLLAGEELLVCYGLKPALRVLEPEPHLRLRIALIKTLRVLVPVIFLPGLMCCIGVVVLDRQQPGGGFRWVAMAAFAVFTVATFFGTVPINARVLDWNPLEPPENWQKEIERWETLNLVRCWAAILTFAAQVAAAAVYSGI